MQLLPGIPNFTKSRNILTLVPIKIGIYKLCKNKKNRLDFTYTYFVFGYKIKNTLYEVYSYRDCKHKKDTRKNKSENGYIKITKGYKSYKFDIKELPINVSNSICKHMDNCNVLMKAIATNPTTKKANEKKIELAKQKINNFIKNLDLDNE